MKFSLFLTTLLLVPQLMWGWSRVGNGGGGFYQNGQYLTFYSAHIKVHSTPLDFKAVPGLSLLIRKINESPMNPQIKGTLLALIYPIGSTRAYYQIADGDMSEDLRKELIEEYRKLTGEPVSNLVLFAMTNDRAETFLMPEFYKLNELQQAVLLLHESLWNLNVEISYTDMVQLEMAAEAHFTDPYNMNDAFTFFDRLGRMLSLKTPVPEVLFQSSFYYTYLQRPPEHPRPEVVSMSKVFSFSFLNCYKENMPSQRSLGDCTKQLQSELMAENPADLSMFDKALLTIFNDSNFKGYLCFQLKDARDTGLKSLFDKSINEWMNKATIESGDLWREDDVMPPSYAPYTAMTKLFKVTEGPYLWGSLGFCTIPVAAPIPRATSKP